MSDKIKLYEVLTWFDERGNHYQACSLYNEWKGTTQYRKEDAVSDGEKHQKALEYLFKGNEE